MTKRKPTIHELEQILEEKGDGAVVILPNGEVRASSCNLSGQLDLCEATAEALLEMIQQARKALVAEENIQK